LNDATCAIPPRMDAPVGFVLVMWILLPLQILCRYETCVLGEMMIIEQPFMSTASSQLVPL